MLYPPIASALVMLHARRSISSTTKRVREPKSLVHNEIGVRRLRGPVPAVLIQLGSLLAGALAAAVVVRALHARRPRLLPWLVGTMSFVALWVAAAYVIHSVV